MSAKVVPLTKRITDGLVNFVANLGTSRDKAAQSSYSLTLYSDAQLLEMYRASWLPQKIIDVPAYDECRRWRSWNSTSANVMRLEEEETRLSLQSKILQARIMARLFGGSALYIGVGQSDPSSPLDPKTVNKGGIKALTLFPRNVLTKGDFDYDINSPNFGRPAWWELSVGMNAAVRVHPSRLVFFFGHRVPLSSTFEEMEWGDSVLLSTLSAITQSDSVMANLASLVFEAKIDVLAIPDLMTNIDDPEYRKNLDLRLTVASTGKGNNGMFVMDAEETYSQKKMNFATLPEVTDRFFQSVAGAADMPMTRLFGMSPGGMNSTGDSDLKNYYDRIQSNQRLEIEPAMSILDQCLVRSALGYKPREVYYEWRSLWQSSEKEEAEISKVLTGAIAEIKNTGLFSQELMFKLASNVLTERGAMASLDALVAATPGAMKPEAAPVDTLQVGEPANSGLPPTLPAVRPRVASLVKDSKFSSLYVYRKVLNPSDIHDWAKSQGFKSALPMEDLHVTVVYSKAPVDWMKMGEGYGSSENGEILVQAGGPRFLERFGEGAVVVAFASNALVWRNEDAKRNGAESLYDEYQPHITITYDFEGDLATVQPYTGIIRLGHEVFEETDEGWQNSIEEVPL